MKLGMFTSSCLSWVQLNEMFSLTWNTESVLCKAIIWRCHQQHHLTVFLREFRFLSSLQVVWLKHSNSLEVASGREVPASQPTLSTVQLEIFVNFPPTSVQGYSRKLHFPYQKIEDKSYLTSNITNPLIHPPHFWGKRRFPYKTTCKKIAWKYTRVSMEVTT